MMAAKRHYDEGSYAGEQARRTQEMQDGGMIREDRSAVANLPQEVMYKPYPKNRDYLPEDLDDTIKGVDHQIEVLDGKKRDKDFMPKKV
jgi:hypothetical protein